MERTCKLTIVGKRCQMIFDLVVKEGMTAGTLLQKLRLRDYSLFRVSGKTGLMVQPNSEIYPCIIDGAELIAANLGWGPEFEDS